MSSCVPAALRRLVHERAAGLCEYCLIHEDDTFFGCQIERVISEKHGGTTESENLVYVCAFWNRYKGTDLGSLLPATGQLTRFFNPRTDRWADHFALRGALLEPLTDIGDVTARMLGFNHPDRVLERSSLIAVGRYPGTAAQPRMEWGDFGSMERKRGGLALSPPRLVSACDDARPRRSSRAAVTAAS